MLCVINLPEPSQTSALALSVCLSMSVFVPPCFLCKQQRIWVSMLGSSLPCVGALCVYVCVWMYVVWALCVIPNNSHGKQFSSICDCVTCIPTSCHTKWQLVSKCLEFVQSSHYRSLSMKTAALLQNLRPASLNPLQTSREWWWPFVSLASQYTHTHFSFIRPRVPAKSSPVLSLTEREKHPDLQPCAARVGNKFRVRVSKCCQCLFWGTELLRTCR